MSNTKRLSTISVSSVRFSADGQRTTHVLGNICDRHLLAELKLPELRERCAIATNKNLYELSQQLADPEPTESGNDTEVPTEVLEEAHETMVQRKLHKMPWCWNKHTNTESDHRRKLKKKASRKLQSILSKQTQASRNLPSILFMETQEIGDAASSRSKNKAKRKKVPTKSSDSELTTSTMAVIDEVTPSPPPPSPKECRAEVSPTKLQSMYCAEMQQRQLISDWSELSAPQTTPQFNVDSITYRFLYDKYQQVLQFIKDAIKTIDDWHAFTLLLFMGTFFYLLYILLYDINEYINEEVRYRQKMIDAGYVLRCFYYVMRLLKVPIF